MNFYRKAEKFDFKNADIEFNDLPKEAKDFIRNEGNIFKAKRFLFENRGYSMQEATPVCNAYWSFLKARDDFRKGKQVYTDY